MEALFYQTWLTKASKPNVSFLVSLEVAQIYLPGAVGVNGDGWVGWSHSDYNTSLNSNWT